MSLKDFLVETFLWNDEDHFREAVRQGNLAGVQYYLKKKKGVDLESRYSDGFTPLMAAIDHGHLGVAQILLDRGAKVDARCNRGRTALHCATEGKNVAGVQLLLSHGAKTSLSDRHGITPHLHAAFAGSEVMFRSLGTVLNGDEQHLKLLLAAALGRLHDLDSLLGDGVDPDKGIATGYTALLAASYSNQVDAAVTLLKRGANPNAQTRRGRTALMFAAALGNRRLLEILLSNGAAPGVRDDKGRSAREYAEKKEHTEIVSLLEEVNVTT